MTLLQNPSTLVRSKRESVTLCVSVAQPLYCPSIDLMPAARSSTSFFAASALAFASPYLLMRSASSRGTLGMTSSLPGLPTSVTAFESDATASGTLPPLTQSFQNVSTASFTTAMSSSSRRILSWW